jgi:hypothetical protein
MRNWQMIERNREARDLRDATALMRHIADANEMIRQLVSRGFEVEITLAPSQVIGPSRHPSTDITAVVRRVVA